MWLLENRCFFRWKLEPQWRRGTTKTQFGASLRFKLGWLWTTIVPVSEGGRLLSMVDKKALTGCIDQK